MLTNWGYLIVHFIRWCWHFLILQIISRLILGQIGFTGNQASQRTDILHTGGKVLLAKRGDVFFNLGHPVDSSAGSSSSSQALARLKAVTTPALAHDLFI